MEGGRGKVGDLRRGDGFTHHRFRVGVKAGAGQGSARESERRRPVRRPGHGVGMVEEGAFRQGLKRTFVSLSV